jgi:CBS domain-containing protein
MKVTSVMTSNVECIAPDATLQETAQRMKALDVGFLPVCENDILIGTITDRDIAIRSVAEGHDIRKTKARDVMSAPVYYCYDDQDISECGHSMQSQSVRRMLVLNRGKNLVGVVSLGDIATRAGELPLAATTLKQVSSAA